MRMIAVLLRAGRTKILFTSAALVLLTVLFMWMGLKAFDKRAMS